MIGQFMEDCPEAEVDSVSGMVEWCGLLTMTVDYEDCGSFWEKTGDGSFSLRRCRGFWRAGSEFELNLCVGRSSVFISSCELCVTAEVWVKSKVISAQIFFWLALNFLSLDGASGSESVRQQLRGTCFQTAEPALEGTGTLVTWFKCR